MSLQTRTAIPKILTEMDLLNRNYKRELQGNNLFSEFLYFIRAKIHSLDSIAFVKVNNKNSILMKPAFVYGTEGLSIN